MLMGSNTIKNIISKLDGELNLKIEKGYQNLRTEVIRKYQELIEKQQLLHFQQKKFMRSQN